MSLLWVQVHTGQVWPCTAYYRMAFSCWTLIMFSELNHLGALSLWGNSGWDLVDSSEGRRRRGRRPSGNRKNCCKTGWKERFSRGGKEKQEPKQSKCWRSEIGARLEDSPTWSRGWRGQGKARHDLAKLCAADRAGFTANPEARICYFSALLCNNKRVSSETA